MNHQHKSPPPSASEFASPLCGPQNSPTPGYDDNLHHSVSNQVQNNPAPLGIEPHLPSHIHIPQNLQPNIPACSTDSQLPENHHLPTIQNSNEQPTNPSAISQIPKTYPMATV